MSRGPVSLGEIAKSTGTSERGLSILLATLAAFGYVKKNGGRYVNTPLAAKWLLDGSPNQMADFMNWWQKLVFEFWDQYFETAIQTGRPPLTIYEWLASRPNHCQHR